MQHFAMRVSTQCILCNAGKGTSGGVRHNSVLWHRTCIAQAPWLHGQAVASSDQVAARSVNRTAQYSLWSSFIRESQLSNYQRSRLSAVFLPLLLKETPLDSLKANFAAFHRVALCHRSAVVRRLVLRENLLLLQLAGRACTTPSCSRRASASSTLRATKQAADAANADSTH